eukprot:433808_1
MSEKGDENDKKPSTEPTKSEPTKSEPTKSEPTKNDQENVQPSDAEPNSSEVNNVEPPTTEEEQDKKVNETSKIVPGDDDVGDQKSEMQTNSLETDAKIEETLSSETERSEADQSQSEQPDSKTTSETEVLPTNPKDSGESENGSTKIQLAPKGGVSAAHSDVQRSESPQSVTEESHQNLQKLKLSIENLRQQYVEAKSKLARSEQLLVESRGKCEGLLRRADEQHQEIEQLSSSADDKMHQIRSLKQTITDLRKKINEERSMSREFQSKQSGSQREVETLTSEIERLRATQTTLARDFKQLPEWQRAQEQFERAARELQSEKEGRRAALAAWEKAGARLKAEQAKIESIRAGYERDLKNLKEERITLERDLTWNKEQNERLIRKSESDQAEMQTLREELSAVKVQLNTADNIRGSESSLEQLKSHVIMETLKSQMEWRERNYEKQIVSLRSDLNSERIKCLKMEKSLKNFEATARSQFVEQQEQMANHQAVAVKPKYFPIDRTTNEELIDIESQLRRLEGAQNKYESELGHYDSHRPSRANDFSNWSDRIASLNFGPADMQPRPRYQSFRTGIRQADQYPPGPSGMRNAGQYHAGPLEARPPDQYPPGPSPRRERYKYDQYYPQLQSQDSEVNRLWQNFDGQNEHLNRRPQEERRSPAGRPRRQKKSQIKHIERKRGVADHRIPVQSRNKSREVRNQQRERPKPGNDIAGRHRWM